MSIIDVQESNLAKRVVTLIKRYPQPKEIFNAITSKQHQYSVQYIPEYPIRDRAIMALYYVSAGRGSEVVGGNAYTRSLPQKLGNKGEPLCVVCNKALSKPQRKFCSKECRLEIHTHQSARTLPNKHLGLLVENVKEEKNQLVISEMHVVKRSQTVIAKYGIQATLRPTYAVPLKTGIYENPFFDQLVPFAWLIKEYLQIAPATGRLFNIDRDQAYRITREVTGNYLNWFRAQGKQFYGCFLFKRNAVELAEFVNDQDIASERPYTRYDYTAHLKDKQQIMDFNWIEQAVEQIQQRIKTMKTR